MGALLAKLLSVTVLKRTWWIESITMLLLLAASTAVSIAGHHGAMLVHMNGIGVMGEHLESDNMPEHSVGTSSIPTSQSIEQKTSQKEADHHDKTKSAPHGGVIHEAGSMHIEMVVDRSDLVFYLLDAEANPIPMNTVSGTVTIRTSDAKTIDLMDMGGRLTAMQVASKQPFTAICTLTYNGKSYTSTFNSKTDLPTINNIQ